MEKPVLKNRFGGDIDPEELREYLDYTREMFQGISSIFELIFRDDERLAGQPAAGAAFAGDSPLDPTYRAILRVIQTALDGRDRAPAGNYEGIYPQGQDIALDPPDAASPLRGYGGGR